MAQPKAMFILGLVIGALTLPSGEGLAAKKPMDLTSVNLLITKRNYAAAFAQLKVAAQSGDAKAEFKLANMYRLGLGTKRDEDAARALLDASAKSGNREAAQVLARMMVAVPATEKAKLDGASGQGVDQINFSNLPQRLNGQVDWLTLAAARGDVKAVHALAPKANASDGSALLAAAQTSNIEIIMALAEAGTPAGNDALGQSPIMFAISNRNAAVTDALLHSKADVQAKDHAGRSVITLAAQNCEPALFEKLLEAGAVLEATGESQPPMIVISKSCRNWSDFQRFFTKADVNAADSNGRSAAWFAAQNGSLSMLGWLIAQNANLLLADKQGMTPLHVAAAAKQAMALRMMLSKVESADIANSRGTTPLMLAAYVGCNECVDSLLKKQADPNRKNNDGDTGLMFAVRGMNIDLAQKIAAAGGNGDARNVAGDTPSKLGHRFGLLQ